MSDGHQCDKKIDGREITKTFQRIRKTCTISVNIHRVDSDSLPTMPKSKKAGEA